MPLQRERGRNIKGKKKPQEVCLKSDLRWVWLRRGKGKNINLPLGKKEKKSPFLLRAIKGGAGSVAGALS